MLGVDEIKKGKFDLIISIGGGSTIDVAKCIKLFMDKNEFYKLPYKINKIKNIAIPTTAGTGSESTQFAVIYKNNRKYSIDNNHLLPEIVILNYKFLISLPEYYKKTTMLDALCQAIESYWCNFATDESKQNSENAIKMILENMDGYIENQKESLEKMLIASNYAGKAINVTRTTAPHAMSYKITDLYNVPHGQAVALCLPYVWEYMYKKYKFEAKSLEIARILKCNNVEDAIKKIKEIYSKMQFEKIHIKFTDIDILVNSVNIQRLENNPIKLNKEDLYEIYKMMINDIG